MTPRSILTAARDTIAKPSAWARGCFARKANGDECFPKAPEACSWCMVGAIFKAAGGETAEKNEAVRFLNMAIDAHRDSVGAHRATAATYNDIWFVTHADVLARLDEAIALTPEDP
jgi:hypothetical protein